MFMMLFPIWIFIFFGAVQTKTAVYKLPKGTTKQESLQIPFLSHSRVPLVGIIDTDSINTKIRTYVDSLVYSLVNELTERIVEDKMATWKEELVEHIYNFTESTSVKGRNCTNNDKEKKEVLDMYKKGFDEWAKYFYTVRERLINCDKKIKQKN